MEKKFGSKLSDQLLPDLKKKMYRNLSALSGEAMTLSNSLILTVCVFSFILLSFEHVGIA